MGDFPQKVFYSKETSKKVIEQHYGKSHTLKYKKSNKSLNTPEYNSSLNPKKDGFSYVFVNFLDLFTNLN